MRRELGWTILELDLDYIRASVLPELVRRDLGDDYHVEVVARNDPSRMLFDSDPDHHSSATNQADASIGLFEPQFAAIFGGGFQRRGPDRGRQGRGPGFGGFGRGGRAGERAGIGRGSGPPPLGPDRGRWLLSVRHRAGSLEALVAQTRRRNLAITGGILLLMLAAAGALIIFTRRAQRLAELQMEFVAGVSHELRTPLSVIRTAAHNLGGRVISNPVQVQRYGALIEEESEKLTDIVDRVLLFSNAKAGRAIRVREVVDADQLLAEAMGASAKILEDSHCSIETTVEPGLPPIYVDPTALKHALLNLISNAVKYGGEGGWIGIFLTASTQGKTPMVEIRVADRGPGIPAAEQAHIFDPFYRGQAPIADQIHGTGLGLSLVKRIVEAHGGAVTVHSEPGKETDFVLRIPAAPPEKIDEFANSIDRG
jgi:signal transduction histidine kinase